jgi:hypothetical protein
LMNAGSRNFKPVCTGGRKKERKSDGVTKKATKQIG